MDVTIEQNCPSCGAPIVLKEDDRLIQCAFCNVHNYKVAGSGSRYVLPAKLPDQTAEDQLIYVPYLRFKGSIFYVRDKEVQYKIVDTTRLGLDSQLLPVSLGLRPQAMNLKPVVSSTRGAFIAQAVATQTVFAHAAMVVDLFSERNRTTILHRAFIGETLSRIYLPCYQRDDDLYDAVGNRVIGHRSLLGKQLPQTCASKAAWDPQFISTLCPRCGGLLAGEPDSMVLQCSNCDSLWQEQQRKFVPVDWEVVGSAVPGVRYLPFWKITFSTTGLALNSFGDFLRFTNQPLVPLAKYDHQPLAFWVPAFKINPKAFLQIASQLTVAQVRIPPGEKRRVTGRMEVTLDRLEGIQAIKSVLANTTLNKENSLSLLPKVRLGDTRCELIYLPFAVQTHDLVQEHTWAAVQTAALRYGRTL